MKQYIEELRESIRKVAKENACLFLEDSMDSEVSDSLLTNFTFDSKSKNISKVIHDVLNLVYKHTFLHGEFNVIYDELNNRTWVLILEFEYPYE